MRVGESAVSARDAPHGRRRRGAAVARLTSDDSYNSAALRPTTGCGLVRWCLCRHRPASSFKPPNFDKGYAMKTILATAAVLLGALLLPVAAYSADKPASASPSSANETASASDAKDRPVRQG